ncbi:MAG: hypothetical protein IT317_15495 [Anaerolineales bacterium]|nr:hypothetical protein [Anaerolineales bacterium]
MTKAGLIIAGVMLVLGTVAAWLQPLLCVPCLALFAGIGGGYLAGQFDKPGAGNLAAKAGAGAGAIGGVGALLAHLIGGAITMFTVGQQNAQIIAELLGTGSNPADNPAAYYGGAFGAACCLGLFEVALLAGLGALGGLLWYQITGKKTGAPGAPAAM